MVDFALEAKQNQNLSAKEANIRACLIRFRLIIMTTLVAFGSLRFLSRFGSARGERRVVP